jgi:hypothetical protein
MDRENLQARAWKPSRRSFLCGGTALGLASMAVPVFGAAPAASAATTSTVSGAGRARRQQSFLDYQPSQQTGWGAGYTPTIGGHTASADFSFGGVDYTVSLLPFGQQGDSPNPVYEDVPADPVVNFEQTLADAWGSYYTFRYLNGFAGIGELSVLSYSVSVDEPTADSSALSYGADCYVTYCPGGGDPEIQDRMFWIEVINWPGGTGSAASSVASGGRANPFYAAGGLTSISGRQVVSFYDIPQDSLMPGQPATVADSFTAETFVAQDTGTKDASGKEVVNLYGGIKWGWQAQQSA